MQKKSEKWPISDICYGKSQNQIILFLFLLSLAILMWKCIKKLEWVYFVLENKFHWKTMTVSIYKKYAFVAIKVH